MPRFVRAKTWLFGIILCILIRTRKKFLYIIANIQLYCWPLINLVKMLNCTLYNNNVHTYKKTKKNTKYIVVWITKKNIFRTYSTFIIVFYCKINYVRMLKILHMKNLAKFRNFSSKLCYQNYFLASSKFFYSKLHVHIQEECWQ